MCAWRVCASGGRAAPFNWLTQSSVDTLAVDYTLPQTAATAAGDTQSSLLFTVGRSTTTTMTSRHGQQQQRKTTVASAAIASRRQGTYVRCDVTVTVNS